MNETNRNFPKQTKSVKQIHVPRLTLEDFKEMDKLLRESGRAKIVIVKNKSGIHIDFRNYRSIYS